MKHQPTLQRKAAVVLLLLALAGFVSLSHAQTAKTAVPDGALAPATSASSLPPKASERIRIEDAGSRIDEVRVGGETQSITVQPKTGTRVPAYEVLPSNTKGSAAIGSSSGATGSRVWNVLAF